MKNFKLFLTFLAVSTVAMAAPEKTKTPAPAPKQETPAPAPDSNLAPAGQQETPAPAADSNPAPTPSSWTAPFYSAVDFTKNTSSQAFNFVNGSLQYCDDVVHAGVDKVHAGVNTTKNFVKNSLAEVEVKDGSYVAQAQNLVTSTVKFPFNRPATAVVLALVVYAGYTTCKQSQDANSKKATPKN